MEARLKENFFNFNLRAEVATDSITLYWERPEGCFGTQYQVFLGETLVGSTQKTHYTISDLNADTSYEITVTCACWNIHMIYCDHVVTHGCTFYSHGIWNGDGWDPDSSADCVFNTGDDSVSIKSGKNPQGNEVNIPTKKVRVFDCRCTMGHGITIGSEMSGGVEGIRIWDCDMEAALCGFEIKGTAKRGGYVKEVHVYDSVFPRVLMHSVGYNDDGIAGPDEPYFSDCSFDHLRLTGSYQDHDAIWHECDEIELCGFEKPGHEIRRVQFSNISFGKKGTDVEGRISLQRCKDVSLNL